MFTRCDLYRGLLLAVVMLAFLISAVSPFDRKTWLLEVFPILIATPVLIISYKRFPLTDLLYFLIAAHAMILICGGAYTYARVPFGFWIHDIFDLIRNPYDKLGHFAQGLVPAMIAREIFMRRA